MSSKQWSTPFKSLSSKVFWASSIAISLGVVSCGQNTTTLEDSTADALDDSKVVLTTFTILADMAQNVAGDELQVESITRIGAEIHGYEPTPSDLVKAQDADLILYNGMNLERWFEQFLGNVQDVPSVILTEGIEPIAISEGPYTEKPNPHAWMSPQNALVYVENIRQAFVELDPDNEAIYNANAAAYSEQLQAIDDELQANLAQVPIDQRYLVSCEGAFSYLARDYELEEVYLWPINAEQQSTPKQIQGVIEKVQANDIATVFCESTVSDEGQREVARATGAKFGGNLYVDSLSTADGPVPTFLDLLEYDVQVISEGLLSP
ncbi:periplasmic chelated iron-binding protein yfea [Leptolyngbya sp. Heron Island J]|uniref:metal ABC transporter substrate-binding protein n=1 Tax=Leptolyngbya sp. Heron Island J TaxID=1385935 RepID=UPI0003B99560|nr:metal ABC transporter substrate-binding protein [Leptolyngbya sp. Heron Island J]ESA36115.1 periplasmic chelated iron-binding protein yfea [Leptolyngbya sp. Heron Island J]